MEGVGRGGIKYNNYVHILHVEAILAIIYNVFALFCVVLGFSRHLKKFRFVPNRLNLWT